ncbi:unnamed protein product [Candidula unifasciata]|uniref:Uncharacterized protein n=1 Tax=Candidula unifasciata TaxID=100452 RepID=A0A8S3ZEC7_9EUPU|nr:unnamed protein product [Candidula unifasciata]
MFYHLYRCIPSCWRSPPGSNHTEFPHHVQKDDSRQLVVWEEWSPCSVSCGAGWRSRAKVCDNCDRNDYENVQSQPCMVNFYCPVDGQWSEWSDFSECSSSCGPGISKKTRRCDSPLPQFGGKNCPGSEMFTKKCEVVKCPVDGAWSLWGTWTLCTATCGKGIRERTRACDSPRPQFGGSECEGSATQQEECYGGQHCPVDGSWSPWTSNGVCRAPRCSRGLQLRSRTCSNPAAAHGGKPCIGQQMERITCYNDHDCPKNGTWCEWSVWSACSSTCAGENSIQGRQRACSCPAPSNGGFDCQGESFQVQDCKNLASCNIPKESTLSEDATSMHKESQPDATISTDRSTTYENSNSSSSLPAADRISA